MTSFQEKRAPLIQPIERNEGGVKTVALTLPPRNPLRRTLRITLSGRTLEVVLYVSANHAHAVYSIGLLDEWRINISETNVITLWVDCVCFKLSPAEGASVRAFLEPLGVRISRHP